MIKGTTLFRAYLNTPDETLKPELPDGFECFYRKCGDGINRMAGWEKTIYVPVDGRPFRMMDIRVEKKRDGVPSYRACVDFGQAVKEIGSALPEPQDILELFPVEGTVSGNKYLIEGEWHTDSLAVFDDIDEKASKAVRAFFGALDKRHERMMPVFDIWQAVPAGARVWAGPDDRTAGEEQAVGRVVKLPGRVKGDNFEDAIRKWIETPEKRKTSVTASFSRYFPSEEEARAWLEEYENQKEEKKDAEN